VAFALGGWVVRAKLYMLSAINFNWSIFLHWSAMEEALSNAGILHIIFTYEGAGRWLFTPPVCKLWKQCYEQLDPTPLHASYPQATIRLTAYGAVFRSPSRLHLACENGLQALFASDLLQRKAGAWCDVPTLLAAQQLGLQVTDSFVRYAAAAGRLDVLQLLHTDQGVPLPADISSYAAAYARMDVLRWLQTIGYAFTAGTAISAAAQGHAAGTSVAARATVSCQSASTMHRSSTQWPHEHPSCTARARPAAVTWTIQRGAAVCRCL
jgi:hypothetical protein